jgi:hypothetical protein
MAKVLIEFETNLGSLEAAISKVEQNTDQLSESAAAAGKKVSEEYRKVASSAKAAFASSEVDSAIKAQAANVDKLSENLELLYKEELRLLKLNKEATAEFRNNQAAIAATRKEFDGLRKGVSDVNKELPKTAKEIAELEDELKKLALEGKQGTQQFKDTAKAIGEYKAAILTADRAVDLYAKSTDAATGRLGELEDKLYDLALAGGTNTQEFKDTIAEVTKLKRAVFEVDQQVDSYVERSRGITSVVQSVELLGNAFQIVEGASAAFGVENEDLQETLVRLNAIMAVTNGLEQVRTILLEQSAKKTGVFAVAQSAYNVVVGTSVGLLKAFRIALAATGLGALVFLLYELFEAFKANEAAIKRNNQLYKDLGASAVKLRDDIANLNKELIASNEEVLVSEGKLTQAEFDKRQARRQAFEEGLKANADAIVLINKAIQRERFLASEIIKAKEETADAEREFNTVRSQRNESFLKKRLSEEQKLEQELAKLQQERINLEDLVNSDIEKRKALLKNEVRKIDIELQKEQKEDAEKALKEEQERLKQRRDDFLRFRIEVANLEKEFRKNNSIESAIAAVEEENRQKELEQKKLFNVKVRQLDEVNFVEIYENRARLYEADIAEGDKSLQARINQIEAQKQAQIEAVKLELGFTQDAKNRIRIIEANAAKEIEEAINNSNERIVQETFKYIGVVQSVFSSIVDLQNELTERRIEQINRLRDVELEAIEVSSKSEAQKQREREALELRTNRKIIEERRKIARLNKAQGIFDAVVNTAVAVTNALKEKPPLSFILAAAAGVAGGIQVAKISSEPLPSFGRGGWIDGEPHTRGGVDINAEGGEFVTRKSQAGTFRRELEAMNTSRASFLKLIENNYVKPRLMAATLERDRNGVSVNVNARLNSGVMETELRGLRQETRKTGKIMQKLVASSNSSRYNW